MIQKKLTIILFLFVIHLDAQQIEWAKKISGSNGARSSNIIINDKNGNILIGGSFSDTLNFDPNFENHNLIAKRKSDGYINKFDSLGNYISIIQFKSDLYSHCNVNSMKIDDFGNLIVIGDFIGKVDFDPSSKIFPLISKGASDVFICKLDKSGNLLWAKSLGSPNSEVGYSISNDKIGNTYIVGSFLETIDIELNLKKHKIKSNGKTDFFILKLDKNGRFIWVKTIGGRDIDYCTSIAIDTNGFIYLTGSFTDVVDFDPSANLYNLKAVGFSSLFICKFDQNGNLIWAKNSSGSNSIMDFAIGHSIILDNENNVYLTGQFSGGINLDDKDNELKLRSKGYNDIFVVKMDVDGNYIWIKAIGGDEIDFVRNITLDRNNNILLTGNFKGISDFDPSENINNLICKGITDIFICILDKNGNFIWASNFGSENSSCKSFSISIDTSNKFIITGTFYGRIEFFKTELKNLISKKIDQNDIFIMKFH